MKDDSRSEKNGLSFKDMERRQYELITQIKSIAGQRSHIQVLNEIPLARFISINAKDLDSWIEKNAANLGPEDG